ncbi:hypothetical protein ABPG75_005519 [Micractinium tetrahymenae]
MVQAARLKALTRACTQGSAEELQATLAELAPGELSALLPCGSTALNLAIQRKRPDLVQLLLDAGADPNARNLLGGSALHAAALGSSRECLQAVLSCGRADPEAEDGKRRTALYTAALSGRTQHVRMLLAAGASAAHACDESGWSALHAACWRGRAECARALLAGGAATKEVLEARDLNGKTALHVACQEKEPSLVALLLGAGADPAATLTDFFLQPLMISAMNGCAASVKALLAAGAAVDARDQKGQTALSYAIEPGNESCVSALLAAGADPNLADALSFTPLMSLPSAAPCR